MDEKPVLAVETENFFLPLKLSRRNLETAVADTGYLRARMSPKDVGKVIAHLEKVKPETDWDRIMQYSFALTGHDFSGGDDSQDFADMGFVFRNCGGPCLYFDFENARFNKMVYEKVGDPVILDSRNSYFSQNRVKLREAPDFRKAALELFNTSYCQVWQSLLKEFERELNVEFVLEEKDGVMIARQKIPEYANPVFILQGIIDTDSGGASARVQRYETPIVKLMKSLAGSDSKSKQPVEH